MNKILKLERELELEKLREKERELEILKQDAENHFVKLAMKLRECRERIKQLE